MTTPERHRARNLKEMGELNARTFDKELEKQSIKAYRPRPTDVVITPFGKSGTTWTQQIFHTLRTRGDMDFDDISRVVPWIETAGVLNLDINADQRAEPRGFKSHLDYDAMPAGAKYINVIRNPVDAAYSMFKFMEGWFIEPGTITPDELVLASMQGAGYYKHFVSWWNHRNDSNVLYLVYEHMRDDHEGSVRRIADFAGITLDDELLALTLHHSSLAFMQQHKDRFDDAMLRAKSEEEVLPPGSDSAKVRAGKVGEHVFTDKVMNQFEAMWQEHIKPVTGFDDYETLIASLK